MKFLPAILLPFLFTTLMHAQTRIGGSDLLAPHLRQALVEYAEGRGLEVEVTFGGSYRALDQLKSGDLDLAVVAIPDGGQMPGSEFTAIHFASKVVTVAVPPSNPLTQLTMRQLSSIFAEGESAAVARWGQLGLSGEWAVRAVAPGSVTPTRHSLALDLFRHTVLQSRGLRRNVSHFENIDQIRRRFQQDNAGIVILHRIPQDLSGLKILSIARSDTTLAYAPTLETVAANEYPIRLPLYLVYSPANGADLQDILRFLVGEEATEALEEGSLAPLPRPRRQRLLLDFERL
jgi:ABC-type phosphate transport system substrate-binding protein